MLSGLDFGTESATLPGYMIVESFLRALKRTKWLPTAGLKWPLERGQRNDKEMEIRKP